MNLVLLLTLGVVFGVEPQLAHNLEVLHGDGDVSSSRCFQCSKGEKDGDQGDWEVVRGSKRFLEKISMKILSFWEYLGTLSAGGWSDWGSLSLLGMEQAK